MSKKDRFGWWFIILLMGFLTVLLVIDFIHDHIVT